MQEKWLLSFQGNDRRFRFSQHPLDLVSMMRYSNNFFIDTLSINISILGRIGLKTRETPCVADTNGLRR